MAIVWFGLGFVAGFVAFPAMLVGLVEIGDWWFNRRTHTEKER